MTTFTCQAAEFLRARGPAQVPLRACCAAAIIRSATAHPPATGLSSAPFVCAAAGLTIPSDARLADEPAAAGLTMAADVRLVADPAGVGAEQTP